jgi:archaellum component FlaG (FlaF/FlaG flagellin family)
MSKGDTFENDLLKLIFNATAIANIADNAATSPLTNLFVSLHTADPGEAGSQTTSECNYTGYARIAVARTSGGFTVTTSSVSPAANVTFANPTNATNLPQTASFFAIGTATSGAGKILYSGALSPTIVISNTGVSPIISSTSTVTED